jgi:hypothetical protein
LVGLLTVETDIGRGGDVVGVGRDSDAHDGPKGVLGDESERKRERTMRMDRWKRNVELEVGGGG